MAATSPQAIERERQRKRRQYLARRSSGACLMCGKPRAFGSTACLRCRRRQRRFEVTKYRAANPGASTIHCGICEEAGHNARSCPDRPGPRCRCGVLLPCLSCIPTAAEMAASRREA